MTAVYQLALADFHERVRRFGFLLVVALAVFLGYQVISGFFDLRLGSSIAACLMRPGLAR